MSPEEVRKAQMQNDPSGLLQLAIKAEEDFYETEGMVDVEQIVKDGAEIERSLKVQQSRDEEEEVDDFADIKSTYSPLTAQYNPVLDYDAHAGTVWNEGISFGI